MTACSFPNCPHPARAAGLCPSHYQQKARGKPLKPLKPRNDAQPMEKVSLRLPPPVAHRVREDVEGARSALVIWAKKAEGK